MSKVQKGCGSPWVQKAEAYVKAHAGIPKDAAKVETLRLLLAGHCGEKNRIPSEAVVAHLQSKGHSMSSVRSLQHTVLGELKRQGALATLLNQPGGVFIPCEESEIGKVAQQVYGRVISELTNLQGIVAHAPSVVAVVKATIQAVEADMKRL